MATIFELIARFRGDTTDLENAGNRAKEIIDGVEKKIKSTTLGISGNLKLLSGFAGATSLAYTAIGLSNEKARAAAVGMGKEFGRLVVDIDKVIGAGNNLEKIFNKLKNGLTVLRAGVRSLGDSFTGLGLFAIQGFGKALKAGQDFLNKYSKAVETATFGLRKAKTFTFADNFSDQQEILSAASGLKTYKQHLKDIQSENAQLEKIESKTSTAKTKKNNKQNDLLEKQNDLLEKQKQHWDDLTASIQEQQRYIRDLRTEGADMFADFALGTNSFRDTAIKAISDIARNLLRLSFSGEAGTGIAGSIATGLFSIFGGGLGSGYNPAVSAPPRKPLPSFSSKGSFSIKGNSGIDKNTLSLNGQPIANVSKGENVSVGSNESGSNFHQTINISTGVQQTVRAELQRMMPAIQGATVQGVQEARLRGKIT